MSPRATSVSASSAPSAKFKSVWIVDRKWFGQATWILRFVACSRPNCKRCRSSQGLKPGHGPYWAFYEELDGRNHLRHWPVNEPLPWGDKPPPSLVPSAADENSRLSRKRRVRQEAEAARALAAVHQRAAREAMLARISEALADAQGNVSAAAEALGVSRHVVNRVKNPPRRA